MHTTPCCPAAGVPGTFVPGLGGSGTGPSGHAAWPTISCHGDVFHDEPELRFVRSDRVERVGKSPSELLIGRRDAHRLERLGFQRFGAARRTK